MIQKNTDLRMFARGNSVPLWAVAKQLGVSEPTLYRHWQEELPEAKKEEIRNIILALAREA